MVLDEEEGLVDVDDVLVEEVDEVVEVVHVHVEYVEAAEGGIH